MNLQSQTVSEAVAEKFTVSGVGNHLPGGAVHLLTGSAHPDGGNACQLSPQHRVIDLLHLLRGIAHRHGAGHIGAVAVPDNAKVHGDEVSSFNHPVCSNPVGQAGIGAGHHNGVKGQPLSAAGIQAVNELRLNLLFRHTGVDSLKDLGKGLVRNVLSLLHPLQLPGLLNASEAVDFSVHGDELHPQGFLIPEKLTGGHGMLLIAQGGNAEIPDGLQQALGVRIVHIHFQDLKTGDALLGSFYVAAVGEVAAAGLGDNGHALGNIVLGTVVTAVPAGK